MLALDTFRAGPASGQGRQARVLIVEDEAVVAEDLRQTLVQIGYEIAALASSGEQAVRLTLESKPDLVLMDVMLGKGMDGINAAHRIRQDSDVPVVFLTAHADRATMGRAKLTEPFGYLVKPFEERSLYAAVEMALTRHAVEQRLCQAESWLRPVFNAVGDGVLAVDGKGCVTFMNTAAEELLGGSMMDCVGANCDQVLRWSDELTREPVENPLWRALRGEPAAHSPPGTLLAGPGGRFILAEASAVPLRDASNRIVRAVLAFRVVGAEPGVDSETEVLREALAVSRAAALDQHEQDRRRMELLLHGISHDLRSPLTVLRYYSARLGEEFGRDLGSQGREWLNELCHSILRIEEMVKGYLNLARTGRPETGKRGAVDMNALAHEVITEVTRAFDGRPVRFDCGDLPPAVGDRALLRQVLFNLASNAVKYSGNRNPACVTISGHVRPGGPVYTVADEGIGFDPAEAEMLFKPFRRLSGANGTAGLGLGLTLVKSIVEAHGGKVTATGRPGAGAVFEFNLPGKP